MRGRLAAIEPHHMARQLTRRIVARLVLSIVASVTVGCSSGESGVQDNDADDQQGRVVIFARHAESWSNVATTPGATDRIIPNINATDDLGPILGPSLDGDGRQPSEDVDEPAFRNSH